MPTLFDLFTSSECTGVITDSRLAGHGKIFFALKGERFDGHLFVPEVMQKGALAAVVEDELLPEVLMCYGEKIHKVGSVLAALQGLGLAWRRVWKCPVIAITGSNGKTTTKELIHAVLSKKYKCRATAGNLNNHIGIPLTLLSFPADLDIAVVEMGANHQGEIQAYCNYTEPDYGLITNIGKAHLEGFGGIEGVIKGKTELYRYISQKGIKVFTPDSGEALMQHSAQQQRIVYGKSVVSTYRCIPTPQPNGFLSLEILPEQKRCITHLVGDYNFDNAAAAVAVGKFFGVPVEDIVSALEEYSPGNNRSQHHRWKDNELIMDAYNANPSSVLAALDNLGKMNHPKKGVILGEMMELGPQSNNEHKAIAEKIKTMDICLRLFVGQGFDFVKEWDGFLHFDDVYSLRNYLQQTPISGYCILVKGSRKNKLEEILA